jgi:tetratricopeptide (TPR) repeat protein
LRVEAVAWASAQGYPLAAVFALGSTLAWLRARDGRAGAVAWSPGWYWASVALAVCAYLAKPVAITLPAILVILQWYRDAGGTEWTKGRTWLAVAPYAIPAILVAAAAPLARAHLGTSSSAQYDVMDRLVQACYGVSYYAIKTVLPTGLTVFTPLPRPFNPFELRFVVAAMGVVAVGGVIWWAAYRAKGLVAAAIAYLVLLAPVLGLIRQGDQLVADRYSYFAGIPLSLVLGGGLLLVAARTTPRVRFGVIGAALVAVVVLGTATWQLTRAWRDAGTLWRHAVAVDPASYQAHTNLGLFELAQGRYDAAVTSFDAAIALNPASSNARFDRGLALAKWGRTDEAIASYQAGLALDPADATAHAHLGDLFASLQRWSDAETEYRAATRLVPHPDLFNSLGTVLAQDSRLGEAAAAFRTALAIDPTHADAQANLRMIQEIEDGTREGPERP